MSSLFVDTCPSRADADKKDCGFGGVTEVSCLQKGCCWEEVRGNFPWCFLRAIQTGQFDINDI